MIQRFLIAGTILLVPLWSAIASAGGPPSLKDLLPDSVYSWSFLKIDGLDLPDQPYAPFKAYDKDINTAWISGEANENHSSDEGGGVGVWLIIGPPVPDGKDIYGIEILPGANRKKFSHYNRPEKVELRVEAHETDHEGAPTWMPFVKIFTLKDMFQYQRFTWEKSMGEIIAEYNKKHKKSMRGGATKMLYIQSIYKGTDPKHVAISEIRFLGKDGKPLDQFKGYLSHR